MSTLTKQQLIEDNMGLVYSLIAREYPTYLHDEDIIQSGMLGLCKAAEKWDESKSKFSTFANICVRSEIQVEFRRRAKHQGVLSLDYEVDNEGERTTFGDFIVGDEDVGYVDLGVDLDALSPKEQLIGELLTNGVSQDEIVSRLGVSKQLIWKTIRKIKAMRGYANED